MKFTLIIAVLFLSVVMKSQNFITPDIITTLNPDLNETSGLVNLNGEIWTHTDNGGETELYQIDLTNGNIIRTVQVHDANNVDWEDIAADESWVYIGDFGNNDGSRTNLRVYRVSIAEMNSSNDVDADKINFSYSDQTSFEPSYHNTNFDCEALGCLGNKLYLFTKNWIDNQTNVYELQKQPGTYIAQKLDSFDVDCLVTGAEIISPINTLLLTGYNESGGTYTWIFNNYPGADFFNGNQTKLIWTSLTQTEGICYAGNLTAYASSEKFSGVLDPTLYLLHLADYLTDIETLERAEITIFVKNKNLVIESVTGNNLTGNLKVMTMGGVIMTDMSVTSQIRIEISLNYSPGVYLVNIQSDNKVFSKKFILK